MVICRHCERRKANRTRGLCGHCFAIPTTRALYEPKRVCQSQGGGFRAAPEEPTEAELDALIAAQLPTMPPKQSDEIEAEPEGWTVPLCRADRKWNGKRYTA